MPKTEKGLPLEVANTEKELTKAKVSPTKPIWIKVLLVRQEAWRSRLRLYLYPSKTAKQKKQ